MENQNITLSVPKRVLRKFKEIAFRRQKSVSGLMVEMMEEAVTKEEGFRVARGRHLSRLSSVKSMGTKGQAQWQREDLHER